MSSLACFDIHASQSPQTGHTAGGLFDLASTAAGPEYSHVLAACEYPASAASSLCVEDQPEKPPVCNTGAEITRCLVDWLGATFHDVEREQVQNLFGAGLDWQESERGGLGYLAAVFRGNVKIYYNGQVGMGVHVEVTGQGCRQLEAEGMIDNPAPEYAMVGGWQTFLANIIDLGGKTTRLDVAIDDRDGLVPMGFVQAAIEEGRVSSRFRQGRVYVDYDLSTGAGGGTTAYFGSAQSQMFVRIYNKAAEQSLAADVHWTRVELQARKERAAQLAEQIVKHGMGCVVAVLSNYLDFKEPGQGDTNRTRQVSASWWSEFLATAEKLRLSVAPARKTLGEIAEHVKKQFGPTLAMLWSTPSFGIRWLREIVEDGASRWRPHHWDTMAAVGAAERSVGGLLEQSLSAISRVAALNEVLAMSGREWLDAQAV